ncbi:aldo/keto reductase [Pedobacter sp. Du54]|uniref:aldo/keto reductase n=1 Tax=Pedobacter anseongensis TaxID=3133439 RepID=UPI0030B3216A
MDFKDRIGFGCVGLTTQPSVKHALNILSCAYENGITAFDTAPIYGQGYSELILGKFSKNKRSKLAITTKFGLGNVKMPTIQPIVALPLNYLRKKLIQSPQQPVEHNYVKVPRREISKEQVKFDFYSSLKRLQTSYIDTYLLHEGTPDFLTDEALEFVFELKEKGLVRKIGLGVCHKNLEDINPKQLINWDILQYENNYQLNTGKIYEDFQDKEHIHHTVLKNVQTNHNAGELIAKQLVKFPEAKVLFSSSKCQNIIKNLTDASDIYQTVNL